MKPEEVYLVLQGIGASYLYHANSVTTSCSFIEQDGLLSRAFVEDNGLKQTYQFSDEIDKKLKVWDCVFVDHVDIHDRAGSKKGPNKYGPCMFRFSLDILLKLPTGTDVLVTRLNPIYWQGKAESARWFGAPDELKESIAYGDFGKIVVIRTPQKMFDFPNRQAYVVLDDPQRDIASGQSFYAHAETRLSSAAQTGGVDLTIKKRVCYYGCKCKEMYAAWDSQHLTAMFG